jgi:hypothetical protein
VKIFEDLLLLRSRHNAYLFNINGEFITRIGDIGQGPGEYLAAFGIEFDTNKREIVVAGGEKLNWYDFEGHFLRTQRYVYISQIEIIDTILWCSRFRSPKLGCYAVAHSLNGAGDSDTIAHIPSPYYRKDAKQRDHASSGEELFYRNNNLIFYKGELYNNDIWKITGTKVEPYAFINLGKYKMPIEYEVWNSSLEVYAQHSGLYWGVKSIVEDDKYFYLFSEKREFSNVRNFKYIIHDKKKKKGFSVKDKNGIGITDDILGGPPVWMRWASNEYYINVIEPYELLEQIEAGDYSLSPQFKEQLSRIGEDNNQIIILCRKKK